MDLRPTTEPLACEADELTPIRQRYLNIHRLQSHYRRCLSPKGYKTLDLSVSFKDLMTALSS